MIKLIIHWYQKFAFHNVFYFQKLFACKNHMPVATRLRSSCEKQMMLIDMMWINKTHITHKHTHPHLLEKDSNGKG